MGSLTVASLAGATISIDDSAVAQFGTAVSGGVLRNGDDGYDEARSIWNAMIDKSPAIIARCLNAKDVIAAVNFARTHGILVSIKGGGHNIAGSSLCDDGLTIDLSQMKSVRVEPDKRVAHAEPGATLGDFDRAVQEHGLATPVGINSTTGLAGLTLGGGFGWLTRKYGLTVDNLTGADIVTADGKLLTVNETDNSDLFWAIRGGGGNFGIVTRFEFKLHPVGPDILAGLIVLPLADAVGALKKYREYVAQLGEESNVWVVLRKAPPLPFLPEEVHGKEVIVFAVFHAGDPEEGQRALDPIRGFGKVLGEHVGVQPYTAWQTAFDPLLTPGARNYWKSHNFSVLSDEAIDLLVKYTKSLPSDECEIFVGMLGGAAGRVAPEAMAYSHRDADFVLNVHGRWQDAADDKKGIGWAREFFAESAPYATGGVYVNFLTADETDRTEAAYGPNFKRLVEVKTKYDPNNLFRLNQNINPSN
jgi:FAD/FMN-containing dehydrogenase